MNFPDGGPDDPWWQESDLLFFAYDSISSGLVHSANRLRNTIAEFYPTPMRRAVVVNGQQARKDVDTDYNELLLVGHSAGGVVIRRAQLDAAEIWDSGTKAGRKPALLQDSAKLLSPAIFGFLPSSWLGAVKATTGFWSFLELGLKSSIVFNELQPGSSVLRETRKRIEMLSSRNGFEALNSDIAYAATDSIVVMERYDNDQPFVTIEGSSHVSVCKPTKSTFQTPWLFVEGNL